MSQRPPQITYTPGPALGADRAHIFTAKRNGGTVEFITVNGAQWTACRHGLPISYHAVCMALGFKNGEQLGELMRQVLQEYVRVLHGELSA